MLVDLPEVNRCDTPRAMMLADSVCVLFDRAFALPPHRWSTADSARHRDVLASLLTRPGFVLVTADLDDVVVGAAYGYPLESADGWWDKVEALPPEFTAESGGRTFVISGLAVDPDRQRKGIGRKVIQRLLADRPEQRVAYSVLPGATGVHALIGQPETDPVGYRYFPPDAPIELLEFYTLRLPIRGNRELRVPGPTPEP
ncbi:GNAT family N-acetyltransferase [Nocardia sp. CA-129566]|uniref:GNAT family N-acetyltransferase n=1 Tax=Nocardia sp. CA-129566 TaxID=3239976 RepID=UPI003D9673F0